MSKALVRIEDTPLFMGYVSGRNFPYIKINPEVYRLTILGPIHFRNVSATIYRSDGTQIHIRRGDTLTLHMEDPLLAGGE